MSGERKRNSLVIIFVSDYDTKGRSPFLLSKKWTSAFISCLLKLTRKLVSYELVY